MFAPGLEMYGISPGIFGDSEMFGGSINNSCLFSSDKCVGVEFPSEVRVKG